MRKQFVLAALAGVGFASGAWGGKARNPVIWADVPDVAAIRVGETYYMSSTTMHMSPGLPIMKSSDLVNWELLGYAYDTLQVRYTLPHFMGYRFGLFNFATSEAGGHVDFDYYRIGDRLSK